MAVIVVSFSFSWVMAFFTASYQQPLWTLTHQASWGPLWPDVAFPTTCRPTSSNSNWNSNCLTSVLTELYNSSTHTQRLLDFWNRMLDPHQAEITVMQFTGHSLPVHQSMSVPWDFFSSSYFISQFPPTRFPFITAIRMCHFLPVHHLGIAFLAGLKVKIQQYKAKRN